MSGNRLVDPISGAQVQAPHHLDRRDFVKGVAALAGAAGLSAYDMGSAAAEPPPEIKKIRLVRTIAVCLAPQYLAEELLRLEGFTDVQYVEQVPGGTLVDVLEKGQADLTQEAAPALVYAMDGHPSLIALAGVHSGCYELIGNDSVRAVRDLKGKRVAVYALGGADHVFLSSMLAYVGLDPRKTSSG